MSIRNTRARRRPLRALRATATAGLAMATGATMAAGAVALGSTEAGAAHKLKKPPYYIGAELSLSGPFASFEIPMLQGLQVAVKDINRSGGVLGHKVALDYQSDASSTTKVTPALQSIFSGGRTKQMIFMLPNVLPPVTDTVLQFTEQYGIASFDPGSGGDVFTITKHPYNYSIYPANTLQIAPYVAAFEKVVGGSASTVKLGVLNDTEAADVSLSTLVEAGLKAAGGIVVGQQQVAPTATDVSVQLSQLKSAGANVVMVQAGGGVATAATTALQTLGDKTLKMVISPADVNAHVQAAIPATVRQQVHTLGEQIYLQGPKGGPLPRYKKFARELAATKTGIDDLEISANIRDAAVLDAWAVNKAKSTTIHKVAKVLNHIGKYKLPKKLLVWMPNPKWTAKNHTDSNANFDHNYWALISPGTEATGTLPGEKLTLTPALDRVARKVASSAG